LARSLTITERYPWSPCSVKGSAPRDFNLVCGVGEPFPNIASRGWVKANYFSPENKQTNIKNSKNKTTPSKEEKCFE